MRGERYIDISKKNIFWERCSSMEIDIFYGKKKGTLARRFDIDHQGMVDLVPRCGIRPSHHINFAGGVRPEKLQP